VIDVGLCRTNPTYCGLESPFGPGKAYPEISGLLGNASDGPPNHVYAAVRAALFALGLDREHFGTSTWNPIGALVPRGSHIVLKPNFIRHWNPSPDASIESVITHGSVIRAVADYAFLAAGPSGCVTIAEAPQHDCDFDEIRRVAHLGAIQDFYSDTLGSELGVIDLRRESVRYKDGVIVERTALPGDPLGYRLIDLGNRSVFTGSGLDPRRFRGADYDPGPTSQYHMDGRNAYLLSQSVLSADLIINLPKLKTHKKTGVTLALKNLVGVNGDKNLLPHHCVGSVSAGGDEFPGRRLVDRVRSEATEIARVLLHRGLATRLIRLIRRAENAARGDKFIRSGNWYGNRTTWRMCIDLNRCLYYTDADSEFFHADRPRRTVLTLIDGIVAGEGEGPLAPSDVPLGVILAATDPVALDLTCVRLMGFDPDKIPKIHEPMRDHTLRITAVRNTADVRIIDMNPEADRSHERSLDEISPIHHFRPHPGWRGHLEQT
jgi:uncharacterized protein (DUF362 family)